MKSATKLVAAGSIAVITRVGVGKLAYMPYVYATSQDFLSLSKLKADGQFLVYALYQMIQKELHNVQGTSIKGITKDELLQKTVIIPRNSDEQVQIRKFFLSLDNLITLHQRKYDKLVNVKKAMLEKMFPQNGACVPEIRFTGFTDAWEQRKVGEIVSDAERPIAMRDSEVYQLVTVKRRNEGVISRGFLKGKDILVKNYFEIRAGDFIISKRQVIHGGNGLVPESLDRSVVSNEYLIVISNNAISSRFWTLMSKRHEMYRMFFLSSYGVDVEKMVFNVEDWKKRNVTIPSMPEQNRIVEYFDHIDRLITLHQRKLEKLQNLKKACLEKMFV